METKIDVRAEFLPDVIERQLFANETAISTVSFQLVEIMSLN